MVTCCFVTSSCIQYDQLLFKWLHIISEQNDSWSDTCRQRGRMTNPINLIISYISQKFYFRHNTLLTQWDIKVLEVLLWITDILI